MTTSSSERLLAFVPQWEYQCCGDPLEVDTTRDLTLTPLSAESSLGSPLAVPVTSLVEHHVPEGDQRHVRARVMEMWEVRRQYEERDRTLYPVAGHDEFTTIDHMEVWDAGWQPSVTAARPTGWLVDLAVVRDLEPDPRGFAYGQDA